MIIEIPEYYTLFPIVIIIIWYYYKNNEEEDLSKLPIPIRSQQMLVDLSITKNIPDDLIKNGSKPNEGMDLNNLNDMMMTVMTGFAGTMEHVKKSKESGKDFNIQEFQRNMMITMEQMMPPTVSTRKRSRNKNSSSNQSVSNSKEIFSKNLNDFPDDIDVSDDEIMDNDDEILAMMRK